jgi:membrane protease YdiL (CAAX protease family)
MENAMKPASNKDIWTYLGFLLLGSLIFYPLIVSAGGLEKSGYLVLGLMWVPGLSAILTVLIHKRGLGSLGWRPGKARYLMIAYCLPIVYGLLSYGAVWLTGLGKVNTSLVPSWVYLIGFATLGVVLSLLSALGEEIGWRGFLAPRLRQNMSFNKATLLTGAIWLLWHTPLILFSDYRSASTPVWYSWMCFAVMIMGLTFAFNWLQARSGSLWPSALLHASHNLWIQSLFDVITINTGITAFLTGEFGAGLAIVGIILAALFCQKGSQSGPARTNSLDFSRPNP